MHQQTPPQMLTSLTCRVFSNFCLDQSLGFTLSSQLQDFRLPFAILWHSFSSSALSASGSLSGFHRSMIVSLALTLILESKPGSCSIHRVLRYRNLTF
ncbi:hypothetical protein Hdeb2414_s0010g00340261 [Helianthus debilis subsp. tardiflorus]